MLWEQVEPRDYVMDCLLKLMLVVFDPLSMTAWVRVGVLLRPLDPVELAFRYPIGQELHSPCILRYA